jgi:NAD(P)-dependent dehydrogenase (short-subunit alcohol dehydrogenase family)
MKRFDGQVAIVTGAVQDSGAATAHRLAREGAAVLLTDVLDHDGAALAAEIRRDDGRAAYEHLDVTSELEWRRAVERALTLGRLAVLINNASVARLEDLECESAAGYERVIAVNQTGTWLGMKAVAPELRKHGGAIVNVASVHGASAGKGSAFAEHASRGAVRFMTRNAAIRWAKERIRVNMVHPGFVDTPTTVPFASDSSEGKAMRAYITTSTPMGRMARPEEIAAAIVFLASTEASFITGGELYVDGGLTAR